MSARDRAAAQHGRARARRGEVRMRGSTTRGSAAALAAIVLTGMLGACSHTSDSSCPTGEVDTTVGKVCGIVEPVADLSADADAFLGIPFAESTGGANRFQPPVPKARMSGVFAATEVGPACPQDLNPPYGATSISEDCLTVNVFRPTGTDEGDDLPVLLWIYGGSFTSGANQYPVYNGGYVAAKENVIVVALNYRVGALGFLAGVDGLTGNYGLKDQQLAMHWVQDNIARFGGDPDRVTIYGESAGAMSVGLHTLSIPSSVGLFRAGIQNSNPLGVPYKSLAQAVPAGATFAAAVGCGGQGLACLQQVSVEEILKEQTAVSLQLLSLLGSRLAGFLVFAPNVDGEFVVADPTVVATQSGVNLPTIMGTNAADGTVFVAAILSELGQTELKEATYLTVLALLFGADNVPAIVERYGSSPTGDNAPYLSNVTTDYLFGCANRYVAMRALEPAYVYRFDETSLNVWTDVPACIGQACHADDVPFTFHADKLLNYDFTPEQLALSDAMVGYWTSFAETLDPNGDGRRAWPLFTPDGLQYMLLDTPLGTAVNPVANCEFWDGIGYEIDTPVKAMVTRAEAVLAE
jgi:carboxylesterase type B